MLSYGSVNGYVTANSPRMCWFVSTDGRHVFSVQVPLRLARGTYIRCRYAETHFIIYAFLPSSFLTCSAYLIRGAGLRIYWQHWHRHTKAARFNSDQKDTTPAASVLSGKYANRKWIGVEMATGESICIGFKTVWEACLFSSHTHHFVPSSYVRVGKDILF